MSTIFEIPEIVALDGAGGLIRIPNQLDIPVTDRVLRLIDTAEFQRLKRISQLGLVSFVYPGANHNRFEHSLGVYRMALLFLKQLAHQSGFRDSVSTSSAEVLILASLLHDIGHWPFCHPMEDLALDGVPTHEHFAEQYLLSGDLAQRIQQDWQADPQKVVDLINKRSDMGGGAILSSILSSPIDIDKMDYLYRDSLHAGVPYGQNFDAPRLIRSLCLNRAGDRLAITHKGKTAAELMVFARYVMFSEVYWHHAVRSATAMFQRAFFRWYELMKMRSNFDFEIFSLFQQSEPELLQRLISEGNVQTEFLLNSLFGRHRNLYKRLATYNCLESESIYRRFAQKPYSWLVELGERVSIELSKLLGFSIEQDHVLIDAPPIGLEVQFDVDVFYPGDDRYVSLETMSPVVQTLAKRQFDDFVKQIRVFVEPSLFAKLKKLTSLRAQVDSILVDLL